MGDESGGAKQEIQGHSGKREKRGGLWTQADERFEEEAWATVPEAPRVAEAHGEVPGLIPGRGIVRRVRANQPMLPIVQKITRVIRNQKALLMQNVPQRRLLSSTCCPSAEGGTPILFARRSE
jgi:hypothetical protein